VEFFTAFADVLDNLSTMFAAFVVVAGDISVRLDRPEDLAAVQL